MTRLLRYSIPFMEREGYAFSDLGGDRLRYGRFGWELTGRAWRYTISPRTLGALDEPEGFEVSVYGGTRREVKATLRLQETQRLGVKRDDHLHRMLLGRMGKVVFVARRKGEIDSYAVTDRREKMCGISELGGSPDGVHSIIRHVTKSLGLDSVIVSLPWTHPLDERIRSLSSGWGLSCWRMVKIIDLCATLGGFTEQLHSRFLQASLEPRKIALRIEGNEKGVELDLSHEGVSAREVDAAGGAITLPEREMVRLLFGPSSPRIIASLPSRARFLGELLPADFFLWPNEGV
jgi:hypothetical protein